jgi:hypothetical protein
MTTSGEIATEHFVTEVEIDRERGGRNRVPPALDLVREARRIGRSEAQHQRMSVDRRCGQRHRSRQVDHQPRGVGVERPDPRARPSVLRRPPSGIGPADIDDEARRRGECEQLDRLDRAVESDRYRRRITPDAQRGDPRGMDRGRDH